MTARRLPRTPRGRGFPRGSGTETVSWPPALRGRSTLLCLLLLGLLGGGLLATSLAVVTGSAADLTFGLTSAGAAALGLLLLAAAGLRPGTRRGRYEAPRPEPMTAPVPQPVDATHDARREPALS